MSALESVVKSLAGLYQSTVTEITAGNIGPLRSTARRGLVTAADNRLLALSTGTPVPSGSDITALSGVALASTDFTVRDSSNHYYVVPLGSAGWRKLTAIITTLPGAFDKVATVIVYGAAGNNDPRAKLASFTIPASSVFFAIGAGAGGIGAELGTYVAASGAWYDIPALAAGWPSVLISIQFSGVPTTGILTMSVLRAT